MKTDFSQMPREEIEAQITMMLLGEMPVAEAEALRDYVASDSELTRVMEEIQATIGFVRETVTTRVEEQLSAEKRQRVLSAFKVVQPVELAPLKRRQTIRPLLALAAMIVFLLVAAGLFFTPEFTTDRPVKITEIPRANSEEGREEALAPRAASTAVTEPENIGLLQNPDTAGTSAHDRGSLEADVKESVAQRSEPSKKAQLRAKIELPAGSADAAVQRGVPARTEGLQNAEEELANLRLKYTDEHPAVKNQLQKIENLASSRPQQAEAPAAGGVYSVGAVGFVNRDLKPGSLPLDSVATDQSNSKANGPRGYLAFGGERSGGRGDSLGIPGGLGFGEVKQQASEPAVKPPDTAANEAIRRKPLERQNRGEPSQKMDEWAFKGGAAETNRFVTRSESHVPNALTGVPPDTSGSVVGKNLASADKPADAETSAFGGGTGLGGMSSTQYYMSNPELMKRYFPQMYEQMQKQGQKPEQFGAQLADTDTVAAITLKSEGRDLQRRERLGREVVKVPAEKVTKRAEEFRSERLATSTDVQDARLLIEQGKLAEAETKLNDAIKKDPEHRAASYYLDIVKEERSKQEARKGAIAATDSNLLAGIDKTSSAPLTGALPTAMPMAPAPMSANNQVANLRDPKASIDQRILQEKVDAATPHGGTVEVVDAAKAEEPAESGFAKLRRSLGGRVERTAKIEIPKEVADVSSLASASAPAKSSYDPYYVQSEFEKIKSMQTLAKVVDELNLSARWNLDRKEAINRLRKDVAVEQSKNSSLYEVRAKAAKPEEAAEIANSVVDAYRRGRLANKQAASQNAANALIAESEKLEKQIAQKEADIALRKPAANAAIPQPEVAAAENALSTFSLNVSDVSFKLAQASLERGQMPEAATVRSEEFINAFDYHDPEPQGAPIGFAWERARYPFAQDRDLLRFSVKTAASGRQANQPMNIVLLLDSSGSMERADRVRIIQECLRTLAAQLHAGDKVSVVAFARTPRLWVDGLAGEQAGELPQRVGNLTPEGGTNLEEALRVAYETARRHFVAGGINRVVLLTDGAANLGDVDPESLKHKVEDERKRGVALDAFGIGWEGLDDQLLEALSRNGDGRYGFVNTPEAAGTEFAGQLAGALHVAASDVKVQVEFNPKRVTTYRQIGYAKHQLTKEQFRDNTVDAAELGAAEAGNALYVVQVNPAGEGPLGTVRVRFKVPGTNDYREHEWPLTYEGAAQPLENAPYTMRLAATASAFSEWLVTSPSAGEVTTDKLLNIFAGVPEHFAPDPRPKKLEWMIRQAKSLTAK